MSAVRLKIGWVISNNREWASSRLQGYLIHEWLISRGYASEILCENFNDIPSVWSREFFSAALKLRKSGCDVIVFEGGEWPMTQLSRLWRRWGKKSVGVRCDPIPGDFDSAYDLTIVPTDDLRQALGITRAKVIDDSVEVREDQFKRSYAAPSRLRVAWVGHQNYGHYITELIARLKTNPAIADAFDFELISKGSFATRQWSEATVVDDILSCDLAMIPIPDGAWFQTKSSNRLILMMALGMPTVATAIPSYLRVARDEEDLLFASSEEDITDRLIRLKDASLREAIGRHARRTVATTYSMDNIGPQWLAAIEEAVSQSPSPLAPNARWAFIAALVSVASACIR